MKFQETETVELKAVAQDGIKKEIVAFANSNGGTVYVGVGDDGTILGVEDADGCAQQVSNMVRDAVRPDATMFVSYETLDCGGKAVVAVKVQRGTNRPYYMAKKGLRPEGVYVRQGYSSVPATDAAIRQMIKETDGDSFEDMRSLDQGWLASGTCQVPKSALWRLLISRNSPPASALASKREQYTSSRSRAAKERFMGRTPTPTGASGTLWARRSLATTMDGLMRATVRA